MSAIGKYRIVIIWIREAKFNERCNQRCSNFKTTAKQLLTCYDSRIRCIEAEQNEYWNVFECSWLLWSCARRWKCMPNTDGNTRACCVIEVGGKLENMHHVLVHSVTVSFWVRACTTIHWRCIYDVHMNPRRGPVIRHHTHTQSHMFVSCSICHIPIFGTNVFTHFFLFVLYDGNLRSICISCRISIFELQAAN